MFEHGYALLLGVDQNRDPRLALPILKNDVNKFKKVHMRTERWEFLENNDHVPTGNDATRANILDAPNWLKAELGAHQDQNKLHSLLYSGHGCREDLENHFG